MSWKYEHIVHLYYLHHYISTDQTSDVLKLKTVDITLIYLMGLTHGDTDYNNLEWLRLNIVDADINACSCLINIPDHQMRSKNILMLVAALVELEVDKKLNN